MIEFIFNKSPLDKSGNKCPVIIEAGTAEGYDTAKLAILFPYGRIYGLEPIKNMFDTAAAYIRILGLRNTIIFNAALAETNGEVDMHVAYYNEKPTGSSSILEPKRHIELYPDVTFKNKEKVKTITLDTFINFNNLTTVDFLWLDLQGYEPVVLKHAPNALKMTKYIYCEVASTEIYKDNVTYPEFKQFLIDNDFIPVDETEMETENGKTCGGNVLFRNKNLTVA